MNRIRLVSVANAVVILCVLLVASLVHADIYRWDNGELITHKNAEPHVELWGMDLSYADLSGADLTGANLSGSTLAHADLSEAVLTRAYFSWGVHGADLTGASFAGANLTAASLTDCVLTDIDLTGAVVTETSFGVTEFGDGMQLTKEQLYSTASYQNKNLQGIQLWGNDLRGWDFSGQRLVGAAFCGCDWRPEPELFPVPCRDSDLRGADLSAADLTNANLHYARMDNADLTRANLKNADLYGARSLPSVILDSTTIYNQWTLFHDGAFFEAFDPVAEGLTFTPSPAGDFDANDVVDAIDANLLGARMRGIFGWRISPPDTALDLNSDGVIDQDDHRVWVQDLEHTWFGDANLDGEFNSSDLVQVFVAGQYEKKAVVVNPYDWIWETIVDPVSWAEGDWNGDGVFDSGDMGKAFVDGGYERGLKTDAAAAPEPTSVLLLMVGLIAVAACRRRLQP